MNTAVYYFFNYYFNPQKTCPALLIFFILFLLIPFLSPLPEQPKWGRRLLSCPSSARSFQMWYGYIIYYHYWGSNVENEMMPLPLDEYLLFCVKSRFPTERRKSPYPQMWHLRGSPHTLWTIQVLYDLCVWVCSEWLKQQSTPVV